jgi:hypothetical protein
VLRRLLDRLEGHWLSEVAAVDARSAAGAEQGLQAGSTAGWLRSRLRMGATAAGGCVRTARALFRGPLTATAKALTDGELSTAHATVLAHGTHDLPAHTAAEAEPVLLEAARRLDPPRPRRVITHLRLVADPDAADRQTERLHQRRGLWLAPTLEGMVAIDGLLEPEAGQVLLSALEPLARPSSAGDAGGAGQRRADALTELARRNLEGGRLPQTGGVRPQLTVTVDLDSLLDRPHALGGEVGSTGPLHPEACRRLACDGALTRVLVTRHLTGHRDHDDPSHPASHRDHDDSPSGDGAWRPGWGRRWRCCLRSLAVPPPSRWRSAAPVGSCWPPNAPLWRSATAVASFRTASGRWPGARPTICGSGCTAARPTWPTWRYCAEVLIAPWMKVAGGCTATPTVGSPQLRLTEDIPPQPEPVAGRKVGRLTDRSPEGGRLSAVRASA